MSTQINLDFGGETCTVELFTEQAPRVTGQILNLLPFQGKVMHAKLSGEEAIILVPFLGEPENLVEDVELGTICYWPTRQTLCIFYGKSKPAAPVSCVGRVITNLSGFDRVARKVWDKQGVPITLKA